jgi:putative heme-binding domain-containing protein
MPETALPVLETVMRGAKSAEARRNALWAAARLDLAPFRTVRAGPGQPPHTLLTGTNLARAALDAPDESVRQVALHILSLYRDKGAVSELVNVLSSGSSHHRRAAAEALGRIGDPAAVPALLAALATPTDHVLNHSLTYALIEIGARDATAKGLASANPVVRRTALTALDQMAGGNLESAAVIPLLTAPDAALKETAWWVAGRHPEWGAALAGAWRDRLAAGTTADQDELVKQLAGLARGPAVQQFLADLVTNPDAPPAARPVALRAMAQAGVRTTPDAWLAALTQTLAAADAGLVRDAARAARALPVPKPKVATMTHALRAVADNPGRPADVRLDALAAVPGGLAAVPQPLFDFLREQLSQDRPAAARAAAADILARAKLTPEQLLTLCAAVRVAGPLEADRLLDVFSQSGDEAVGLALLAALNDAPARAGLRVGALKPRLAKFGPPVQRRAEELYAALNADEARQRERLDHLLGTVGGGDVRRGQQVFHSPKAACVTCHAVGYLGGKLGPDLTKIGAVRTDRDLLESIAFPSASFVRSYEPVAVTTKGGQVHNGLLRKDGPDEVILATGADQEVRVPRADVDEVQPGVVSVMPSGLDQQLSQQELADLIAFLRACK